MSSGFEVWAPRVEHVALVLDERRFSMKQQEGGWWRADQQPSAGARYGFSLGDGPVLPDPRSHSQPDGVHGLSEVVDHDIFAWTDEAWPGHRLPGSVIYELHVGTFTSDGTFEAAIDRLPHLIELGVDAVELMPAVEFPGDRGWGYDGVDLYAPHHAYGGPEGLKRLVDACHSHGLSVILDVVYNHLGPDGNYLAEFGPYFSDHHQTNWGPGVNFDGEDSREVRRFVLDNAAMWFSEYHIDGLRLDAVHAIIDDSPTHILEELAVETERLADDLGKSLVLIAESDENDPRYVQSRPGGMGLDGVWADEWHHALHALFTGETDGYYEDFGGIDELATALRQAWVYTGRYSPHRGRVHGESPGGLPKDRFVVFTQNHDQVGNRAGGERTSMLMSEGRLTIAAALLLTGPFTPMLFQGEEWGASTPFLYFTDHQDPKLGTAVSEGRRTEFAHFGWDPETVPDPQAETSFAGSKLNWEEQNQGSHRRLLDWHRRLIWLRKNAPESTDAAEPVVEVDGERGSIEMMWGGMRVLANIGAEDVEFEAGEVRVIMDSGFSAEVVTGSVRVPPDGVAIVTDRL